MDVIPKTTTKVHITGAFTPARLVKVCQHLPGLAVIQVAPSQKLAFSQKWLDVCAERGIGVMLNHWYLSL